MAEIIIRKVSEQTKALLRQRAERRGLSLEADLRDTLERIARESADSPDEFEPFGQWLVSISRPGVDLQTTLEDLRSSLVRPLDLE